MELSPTIQAGIKKGIIELSEDGSRINYIYLNKSRSFTDPEEKVQAETYISLIVTYNYPKERIDMFVKVQMGSETREADIVVYADDAKTQPYIIVECKKNEISEAEFKKAVDQGFSYAYALAGTIKFVYVTSGLKSEFYKVDKDKKSRETITSIPFYGKEIPLFKYVKGGRQENEDPGDDAIKQQYFDLKIITESDLTHAFQQAHQALWAGGQLNPSEAFDELDKLIFCKIWDERKPRKNGEPYDFQIIDIITTEGDKEQKITLNLYKRILALYEEGRKKDKEVFRDDIRLTPQRVRIIVGYLQEINLSKTDLDSKGRAFETFMGSYFRGDFGQFFTPRNVVKFIVDCLPIKNDRKVLDSSCGSGGFLLYALDKVRKQASEYFDSNTVEHFRYWHEFAEQKLFGMEINEQIARSAKMNMIIHDDGHTNVISSDGLLHSETIIKNSGNQGFEYGSFDFIITNPPFGSMVKQTESAYLHQYKLGLKEKGWLSTDKNKAPTNRDSQSTEVLFIEQDFKFLTDGGFLAIVIPDGILTNSSLQYVRDEIMKNFRIVAVVSLPQTAFAANGAGVKSSVLFLRKLSAQQRSDFQSKILKLQSDIKRENNYLNTVSAWEQEKKDIIKKHIGFENTTCYTDRKDIEKTDEFKNWKRSIIDSFNAKIADLQDKLNDILFEREKSELINYQIFMAMAEQIGYDATGKTIAQNDLNEIAPELEKFINSIIKNEEIFFLNNDKFFLINRNELEGRWDPVFTIYNKHVKNEFEYPLVLLKDVLIKSPQYGTAESGIERKTKTEPRYIRITDIDELGNLIDGLGATAENFEEQYILNEGDILFARSGATVGKTYLHKSLPYQCFFAGYMIRIVVNKTKILPEYLFVYTQLQPYKDWVKAIQRAAAQPNINAEEYKSLPLALPPLHIQQQIVEKYNSALKLRRSKLALSKQKLDSIDDYLLDELGITLPKEEVKKMFFVDFIDVVGGRLDPSVYLNKIKLITQRYANVKLSNYVLINPITSFKNLNPNSTISFIPMESVDEKYAEVTTITEKLVSESAGFTRFLDGDLLWAKITPCMQNGKSAVVRKLTHGCGCGSTEFYVLRPRTSNILVDYLHAILHMKVVRKKAMLYFGGSAGQQRVSLSFLEKFNLPLPPLDKQQEIADHITTIRSEAKALENQAEEILAKAREEVEKMILGK